MNSMAINSLAAKRALSVTLNTENVTWLKGRARGGGATSVSNLLDQLVTAARKSGRTGPSQSVVDTIDIDSSDPNLEGADAAVRAMYEISLGRPLVAREKAARYSGPSRRGPAKNRRG